jgi:hypothetical protein
VAILKRARELLKEPHDSKDGTRPQPPWPQRDFPCRGMSALEVTESGYYAWRARPPWRGRSAMGGSPSRSAPCTPPLGARTALAEFMPT